MKPSEFVEKYGIKALTCCFSGGKDSLVSTHFTLSELEGIDIEKYVVIADTTVMVPGNIEFVKEIAKKFNWGLQVLKPEIDFWTLVGEKGYPMPSLHRRWCCFKLKLEPIRNFTQKLPKPRAEVTGLRRDESIRRRGLNELFFLKGGEVWKYAPIIDWNEKQVLHYMREHDLPMPPHYHKGIKETCLCGAYSSKKQMLIVRSLYPEFFKRFIELEKKFKSGGACFYFQNKPVYAKNFMKQKRMKDF